MGSAFSRSSVSVHSTPCATRRRRGLVLLAQADPGKSYVVRSVYERDPRLLEFLDGRGIKPGERIRVVDRNYDQTLTLATKRGEMPLGNAAAEKVWVSAERAARADQS